MPLLGDLQVARGHGRSFPARPTRYAAPPGKSMRARALLRIVAPPARSLTQGVRARHGPPP
ncbi:hypothetical protein Rumeso_04686 [Rubellimicrobium mesophilum DSM 19309]|uniref:Uncharacterized protein n=1 Tax=Rubellimicrobium mesophilum DSM 19309 TaxID=442562 RepID=A0A017HGZ2_9RHOB|nr:hypothetical protein Rumeso_04686 [Rubellimicrobium mesophilum DSM 19309]